MEQELNKLRSEQEDEFVENTYDATIDRVVEKDKEGSWNC